MFGPAMVSAWTAASRGIAPLSLCTRAFPRYVAMNRAACFRPAGKVCQERVVTYAEFAGDGEHLRRRCRRRGVGFGSFSRLF